MLASNNCFASSFTFTTWRALQCGVSRTCCYRLEYIATSLFMIVVRGMHYAVAPNTPPNVIYRNRGINSLTKKCLGTFFGSGRVTCQLCSASYEFQLKCTFWDQRIVKIVLNTQYSSLSKKFSTLRLTTTATYTMTKQLEM